MNIDSIQNGYVIDHITAGNGMKIYDLLGLDTLDCPVAIIRNASSSKLGKKDIIKVDRDIDLNLEAIGYIDPGATVNYIKDSKLIEKKKLCLPEKLVNVIRCKNPRCITSVEQQLDHVFKLVDRDNKIYRCMYCETKYDNKKI